MVEMPSMPMVILTVQMPKSMAMKMVKVPRSVLLLLAKVPTLSVEALPGCLSKLQVVKTRATSVDAGSAAYANLKPCYRTFASGSSALQKFARRTQR